MFTLQYTNSDISPVCYTENVNTDKYLSCFDTNKDYLCVYELSPWQSCMLNFPEIDSMDFDKSAHVFMNRQKL